MGHYFEVENMNMRRRIEYYVLATSNHQV